MQKSGKRREFGEDEGGEEEEDWKKEEQQLTKPSVILDREKILNFLSVFLLPIRCWNNRTVLKLTHWLVSTITTQWLIHIWRLAFGNYDQSS